MTRFYAWIAVAVVLSGLAGSWLATQIGQSDDRFAQCRSGTVAGGAGQIGGPFELVDAQGRTVTETDVITEPSIVYFGYTFCPDVCPLDVARNAQAVDLLAARGLSATPIFITVDPARDTPDIVGDFAANMHEKMIGLTGSPDQIDRAAQAYRVYYQAHPDEDGYYLVDHSSFSYLMLPDHGFVTFFRRDTSPQDLADRMACFIEAA